MKTIKLTLGALILSLSINGQETPKYKIVGNEIVKIEQSISSKKQSIKTELTYRIKDSVYQVYETEKGNYYILRKSKKTGKEYKQYLQTN